MQSHPSSCCSPLELHPLSLLRSRPVFSPRLSHARASVSSSFRLPFFFLSTETCDHPPRYLTSWTKLLRDCILNKISPEPPSPTTRNNNRHFDVSFRSPDSFTLLSEATSCSCPSSRSPLRRTETRVPSYACDVSKKSWQKNISLERVRKYCDLQFPSFKSIYIREIRSF